MCALARKDCRLRCGEPTPTVCFGKKLASEEWEGGAGGGRRGSPESVVDDYSIVRLFEQLYQEVHTWSSEFVTNSTLAPTLTADDENLIRHVVLVKDLSPILRDRSLRRKVVEGIVGHTISSLEARQDPPTEVKRILPTILKFASPGTQRKQVGKSLNRIFRARDRILREFTTQTDSSFTIENPNRSNTTFDPLTMNATTNGGSPKQGQVMILVFPGVFKVSGGRTCLVKARVCNSGEGGGKGTL